MNRTDLFAKYDLPVPRYTSYPTVPQWHATPTPDEWVDSLTRAASADNGSIAIYVHLPFCESLCSYCGCNTVITRDHGREGPYVDLVLAELDLYLSRVPSLAQTPMREIHLGGGTPTFLSSGSLVRLIDGLIGRLSAGAEFIGAVEVDPRVTTIEQLETMRARGFRRISLGVQDIDPEVQHLVNRHQPVELTATLCAAARDLGYESLNVDLIYGLPGQTPESMTRLVPEIVRLAPDRLAVYSFARVPWIKPAQRRFRDDQIPTGAEKRRLYEIVRDGLLEAGYLEIGLDHFARPHDSLAVAAARGTLHRNFMGYTDVHTTTMVALGVSGISETDDCYHQNEKVLTRYEERVRAGEIPTHRGHRLSPEDRRRRAGIASLMNTLCADLSPADLEASAGRLAELADDGLLDVRGHRLIVRPEGRPFLRNIAAAIFDEYAQLDRQRTGPLYSTSA
ncbi:MAG: oxygen-independent coproporphyrinogen III oxidase [Acidobacteria bacterium]|nr:oxygen-independent coproporphyrinogen III oxidase [Acidobacteriota bacterium]